jgi:CBS domain-containing protein/mannitol/fructose-specific phosphotransferase system IIA component (Ntr-type)
VKLTDLLNPRRVIVPLAATTLEEGMGLLIDACKADGRVSDPERLDQVIRESWPEDTMSIGPHAWLPHFRTDAVPSLVVALGIAREPMTGRELGTAALPMILLIVAPPGEAAAYLQTVAAFARALARPEVAEQLLAARSAEEVLSLPALRDIELHGQLLVRDIMTARIPAVHPETSLAEAAQLLVSSQMGAVPVVAESGALVGMLSHRELLRYLVPAYVQRITTGEPSPGAGRAKAAPDPQTTPVREAMARNVLCVSEDQSVAEVAQLLASKDVERVPVVEDGILRGFLTRADIVRKVLGAGGTGGGWAGGSGAA